MRHAHLRWGNFPARACRICIILYFNSPYGISPTERGAQNSGKHWTGRATRGVISAFGWGNNVREVYASLFGIRNSRRIGGVISGMPWGNFCRSGTGVLLAWENVDQANMYAHMHACNHARKHTYTYRRMHRQTCRHTYVLFDACARARSHVYRDSWLHSVKETYGTTMKPS